MSMYRPSIISLGIQRHFFKNISQQFTKDILLFMYIMMFRVMKIIFEFTNAFKLPIQVAFIFDCTTMNNNNKLFNKMKFEGKKGFMFSVF